jgi:hypothetical protein
MIPITTSAIVRMATMRIAQEKLVVGSVSDWVVGFIVVVRLGDGTGERSLREVMVPLSDEETAWGYRASKSASSSTHRSTSWTRTLRALAFRHVAWVNAGIEYDHSWNNFKSEREISNSVKGLPRKSNRWRVQGNWSPTID